MAGAKIIQLLAEKGIKSFLVFLPGWFEIETFNRELSKMDHVKNHKIIKLHSTMGMDDLKDLYDSQFGKKIVLSTNIAGK